MKEEVLSDAYCQQLLKNYSIQQPGFSCPSHRQVVNVCTNAECKDVALFCGDELCDVCHRKHQDCSRISFKALTKQLMNRQDGHRSLIKKTLDLQHHLVRAIQAGREAVVRQLTKGDLEQQFLRIIEQTYHKGKRDYMTGRQAHALTQRLKKGKKEDPERWDLSLEKFRKDSEQLIDEFQKLRLRVVSSALKFSKVQHQVAPIHAAGSKLDSNLIKSETDESRFVWECLGNPKKSQLMFKASDHGFKAAKFHQYCDGVSNTLTILRTEYGKTVAAFTPCAWRSQQGFIADQTQHSCIISVDARQIFKVKDTTKAILCAAHLGPHFGAGCDFAIQDNCGDNSNSGGYFPTSYYGNGKFQRDQRAWTTLYGSPEGNTYRVVEYQVFRITF